MSSASSMETQHKRKGCRPRYKACCYLGKDKPRFSVLTASLNADSCRCRRNCRHRSSRRDHGKTRGGNGYATIKLVNHPEAGVAQGHFRVDYMKLKGGEVKSVSLRGPVSHCSYNGDVIASLSAIYLGTTGSDGKLDSFVVGTFSVTSEQARYIYNGETYIDVHTESFQGPGGEISGQLVCEQQWPSGGRGYGDGGYQVFGDSWDSQEKRIKFLEDDRYKKSSS